MERRKKIIIVVVILAIILVPTLLVVNNLLSQFGGKGTPWSLDDAPQNIVDAKVELKEKLSAGTFIWDDMATFVVFTQYLADNAPDILSYAENWEATVIFDFGLSEYLWFIVSDGSVIVAEGDDAPEDHTIIVYFDLLTFIEIMREDKTALTAWQNGDLSFDGPFNDVLTVAQVAAVISATIMDTYTPPTDIDREFIITNYQANLYAGGLTLFPLIEIEVDPLHIGEHHASFVGLGSVVILDYNGNIVAQLEESSHTVHKFMNSTTVIMGGQEGDMELWNFVTDKVETLSVPAGHHELDYNPVTDTFMILEYAFSSEIWDGKNIIYDVVSEYDRSGALVWQWDPEIYFPFNSSRYLSLGANETFRGGVDWTHANSFAWDKVNDAIYLNVRNQDTVLKINYTTKQVVWDAGRNGDFTILNATGDEVDSIFYHTHSLEQIGPDRFITYDNDLYNPAKQTIMDLEHSTGDSRFVEFTIDADAGIMREVWSWGSDNETYYFPESGGDADRLPNGNTLGHFAGKALVLNVRDPVVITEVTPDGVVAWEVQIPGVNDTYYWVHRVERFYEEPLVSINEQTLDTEARTLSLNFTAWDTIKQDAVRSGTFSIVANGQEVHQDTFQFLPQWQPNIIEVELTDLPASISLLQLIIENEDGITSTVTLYGLPPSGFPIIELVIVLSCVFVAIPVIIWLRRSGKLGGGIAAEEN
ncbi:MAG: aryl-sulfate sulfotransferase [Candidatus Thorarchaeota archaeon]